VLNHFTLTFAKTILKMRLFILFILLCFVMPGLNAQSTQPPLRLAVAGMTHGHIGFLMNRKIKSDLQVVGVYEPNTEMALRYAKKYNFDPSIIYTDLDKMLEATKPEAVVAFGSIYDHLAVVEKCAPRGIHVMVEKPLATTVEAAVKMQQLASKHNIHLLTDYETSWYPTVAKTYQLVKDSGYVGNIKKVVIHDGHQGPKEINVNKEFFDWLTDPVLNGGGALIDFGCYGANLMTWLMGDEKPVSVTAVTQQFKPDVYPKVDDEATIIVSYPTAQCIIQASWNWPFGRKDMEVYGTTGYIVQTDNTNMRLRGAGMNKEQTAKVTDKDVEVYTEPFAYMIDVIRGKIKVPKNGLYSAENNVTVVKILSAARESAKTGKAVKIN
jgi:predicted dehydrogenase